VFAEQRVFGLLVMIEWNLFPAAFDVARLTLEAEFPLVLVVFFMARIAIGLQFFLVQITLVATDAFCVSVFAEQRVLGLLVMIEYDLFPAGFIVASLAFGTKGSFVLIDLLVTLVAKLGRLLEFIIRMASLAFHFFVFAQQFKFRFAVVKVGSLPVLFLVAILALWPQTALMFIRLFMTTVALGRCFAIFFQREMTVLAKNFAIQVSTFEKIARIRVIKSDSVHDYDACISAFMVGMAFFAWLFFLKQTVIALPAGNILGHFFVTVFA
jgi:hypothetical protein